MTICRWNIHIVILRLPDSWSNWNLEMLIFEEKGKPEYPEKNLSEQGREPTTNSAHIWSTPGFEPEPHWWQASALTTAPPLLPAPLLLTSIWRHLYFCIVQKKRNFVKYTITSLYVYTP